MFPAEAIAQEAVARWGAQQKPSELAGLLGLVGPADVVVEVGCDRGGMLWAFRQVTPHVFGVTLPGGWFGTGGTLATYGADVVVGDSHDPATFAALARHLGGRPVDLLFVDADHRYEAVAADFEVYAPLVRPGGLVALHDICEHPPVQVPSHGLVEVGVSRLWREISARYVSREIVAEPADWGGIGLLEMP